MRRASLSRARCAAGSTRAVAGPDATGAAIAQPATATYYQCPGNVFTNTISAKEAETRKCTPREAKEPTTITGPKPRAVPAAATSLAPAGSGPATVRVDPADQRARDSDARRILETELRTEEERLAAMQKEFNNGEPERQGNERNYQKYIDRVAEMRSAISRKEADIAAIKREIGKLPK
jgi:hypothetical protein